MSIITYQYRIKDSSHRNFLSSLSHRANIVWNYCNEVSLLAWRRDRKWLTAYDLINLTAGTSKALGLHSQTVQAICEEYATRRKQFRKVKLKWRSKKRSLGWIPFKVSGIKVIADCIKYGGRIFRLWLSRKVEGKIKAGSFSQDNRGRWYVNLQCEVEDATEPVGTIDIGIDLGLKHQAACSDGMTYSRENLTKRYEDDLAMAQRAGKKRRTKAIHAKIKNVRKDWTHKVTTEIARKANRIVVGDVSSTKLAKTRFAKSTYDAAWGMFRHQLHYKAIRLAGVCVPGNEMFSTVTCSACFERTGPSGVRSLGVRVWQCSNCGVVHNRDTNAAKVILRLGHQTPIKGIPRA